MVDAGPIHDGIITDYANIHDSKYAGLAHQVKHPTLYGPRDPSLRITAERVDLLVNVQTGERQRLMVNFRNIGLRCERETQESSGWVLS